MTAKTISFCQYINGYFSIKDFAFHNLQKDEQEEILNYKLSIYICEGTDSEKLNWFKIINIAGEKITRSRIKECRLYRRMIDWCENTF